ncbi:DcrB-related protein [Pantoea sp. App145]|uniref:DcrB-related protein n=1 Tax=Pantoea sp. App145 TaxID=3071567 RepID=UPI003A81190D
MNDSTQFCLFTEGLIALPDGYQDRTVNVFTVTGAGLPAFNISRDTLHADEALDTYIDRQLALMAQHLQGWKQLQRASAALGENLLSGEIIHASYLRDGRCVWQQQAVFTPDNSRVLVFTMTSMDVLSDTDTSRFASLLRSFRFHA